MSPDSASGLETVFLKTRNWSRMAGQGNRICPEMGSAGLGLGADTTRVHKKLKFR